ncbi:MAG: pantetheine-phosphate adenylyltransferase [Actinobacteria bacterium]|nr:MAG: pantetheine-phosphate adenylyltransferase [Actinomycetota bacterium]
MSTALCPGSFDPVTHGHIDIIERTARQFDRVIVAVSRNPQKSASLFTLEERQEMLEEVTAHLSNVELASFEGLLVDFAKEVNAQAIVKGLRAVSDFDYELQMAQMNQQMSGIDTFFISTSPQYSFLSSSLVREVARFGGDVSSMVPPSVSERLMKRYQELRALEELE